MRLNARLIRSEHRDGYRTGHADYTARRAPRKTSAASRRQKMCSRSAWLPENVVLGSASETGVSRTRHMAPSAIDAKAAERCAAIADPSRRATRPPASPAPVTDVALSPSPQNAACAV